MTEPNYYELLGVMRNAPPEVIRGAYKALAQKYHPDKNPGDAEAAKMMTALNRAALTLLNAEKRQAYDEFLNGQAAASPEPCETPEPETVTPNPPPKAKPWWALLVTLIILFLLAKLIGFLGTLIACFVFYWVKPRRGTGQAAAAAGIVGVAVAVIFSVILLPNWDGRNSQVAKHPVSEQIDWEKGVWTPPPAPKPSFSYEEAFPAKNPFLDPNYGKEMLPQKDQFDGVLVETPNGQFDPSTPMATPNCSTYGRSNCSRQDRVDYDYSGLTAMRAAASLRR